MPTTANPTNDDVVPAAGTVTMRAVVQDRYGDPSVLRCADIEVPDIAADEVLVAVDAAGLDRGTWHLVTGLPLMARLESGIRRPKRRVPGFDVSGTVVRVGAEVTEFAVGDAVCGIGKGSVAEYAPALADKLAHRPPTLDAVQAGTLAISGITALCALRDTGRLKPGQHVLVYGASGGVGTYAVQIARSMGARVAAVCSSAKADAVRALGAEQVLPYDGEDAVDALDGSVQYDVILDIAGGRGFHELRRALAPDGTSVFIGMESGGRLTGGFVGRLLGTLVWSIIGRRRFRPLLPTERGADVRAVVDLAGAGEIEAQIDRVIGLADVAGALEDLAAGRVRGKVAVRPASVR